MAEPHISTIVKDYVTAIAIVAGGVWALWRWSYGEILRRRREMASPDGTLSVAHVELDSGVAIVTLNATWRNRGQLLIELCPEHSNVKVYRLASSIEAGALNIHEEPISKQIAEILPWWSTYILEPNTESIMQEHIALEMGHVYVFRWRICLSPGSLPGRHAKRHLSARRDLVWQAPNRHIASDVQFTAQTSPAAS